ncbi:MAG TPA: hypothetical protein VMU43_15075 [Candidatus Acidoferrum sp.]|nr:hypothetical protein [Candidatus Acidoferrum sp.]
MNLPRSQRLTAITLVSISLPAFSLEPFVHEFLGHAVTAWLVGAKVILVSSTAMQTSGGSRLIPASGPLSNLVFGAVALLILRQMPRFTPLRYFLWIFTLANLFLGFGYILYSGLINFGDSAYVIAGLRPAWLYRAALIVFGAWGYRRTVGLAARDLLSLIGKRSLLSSDVPRVVYPSCVAGSLLYLIASFFNPVSPSLILYDGVSMAAGIAIGFCSVPRVVSRFAGVSAATSAGGPQEGSLGSDGPSAENSLAAVPFSSAWFVAGILFSVAFVIFMGHGFRP